MAETSAKEAKLRFRPPAIEGSAELDWVLRAAFSSGVPPPLSADRSGSVLKLAQRLGLTSILGARHTSRKRASTLPEPLSESFRKARAHSAIRTAVHERSARHLAGSAERLGVPLVFLKGFALFLTGRDCGGGRPIGDLDLLAPEAGAKTLHAELRALGYQALGEHGNEHHLAPLVSPEGSNIDLHFCLRGLSFDASAWATWEDLDRRNLLPAAAGFPGRCAIPEPGLLTAHLLVHGLSHHIWRPNSYPLLQLPGDLQELLPDEAAWQRFESDWRRTLLFSIRAPELDSLRRLTLALRSGLVPDLEAKEPGNEAILLRHVLAGYLDAGYGRRLRLRHALDRLGDALRQGRLGHYLARKTGFQRLN